MNNQSNLDSSIFIGIGLTVLLSAGGGQLRDGHVIPLTDICAASKIGALISRNFCGVMNRIVDFLVERPVARISGDKTNRFHSILLTHPQNSAHGLLPQGCSMRRLTAGRIKEDDFRSHLCIVRWTTKYNNGDFEKIAYKTVACRLIPELVVREHSINTSAVPDRNLVKAASLLSQSGVDAKMTLSIFTSLKASAANMYVCMYACIYYYYYILI
jgi:hypothetical protein